ncbi:WD repeat-containing protein 54-like [Limulus polyphemus]|uniref:WD repeat-containing protein 54-like n=1 Tax=Limulus polyphemus TaxID=6850 RepID=A0ABM1BIS6_LIMPO|nr:WD repeat-containing protein 54-like [Limulus polyphemus]
MYHKETSWLMNSTASALNNNLCSYKESNDKVHFAVVHKGTVNIVTVTSSIGSSVSDSVKDSNPSARTISCNEASGSGATVTILQAKWVTLRSQTLLVISTLRGIQVFEMDGTVLLFWHRLETDDAEYSEEMFARGIAACGQNLLCVGTHDGSVLIFSMPAESNTLNYVDKVRYHPAAISDLCGQGQTLISGDDHGNLVVWEGSTTLKKVKELESFQSPATSIACWEELVMVGYGSGHIRLFNITTGIRRAEITAHASWITAVDIALESGLAISVSEDSFVRVWQLKKDGSPVVSYKSSCNITNIQLCGGCFVNNLGSAFCTTGYDLNEILYFHV